MAPNLGKKWAGKYIFKRVVKSELPTLMFVAHSQRLNCLPLRMWQVSKKKKGNKNHSTQDSRVVPHRGTNWAALWLTAQIRRDAVLSESYGRG